MKAWLKDKWLRFKTWFLGILAALGLVTAAVVVSAPVTVTYVPATEYTDGTPMPLDQIAETRLYCKQGAADFALVASEAGADGDFEVELSPGNWTCVATHIATNTFESAFSNESSKLVLPTVAPKPPVLN